MSKSTSDNTTGDATASQAAARATQTNVLPLDRPALLGTFGTSEKPGALVRLSSGDVVSLSEGQLTQIGEVLVIANGEVIVAKNGQNIRLVIPDRQP
jgi:hypothetical protein